LKPNNYGKADWKWLLGKVEKKISQWCNCWLSRGGCLVLIKFALEAIPVYWHTLAHIPKGILEKIIRCCFNFLWQGSDAYKGTHWVSWGKLAVPKSLVGWGLKDINLFGKSLVAKSLWNMLTKDNLWKWKALVLDILVIDDFFGLEGRHGNPC
jgi:hypothetical protein